MVLDRNDGLQQGKGAWTAEAVHDLPQKLVREGLPTGEGSVASGPQQEAAAQAVSEPSASPASTSAALRDTPRKPTLRKQISNVGEGLLKHMKSWASVGNSPSYLDNILGQEFVGAMRDDASNDGFSGLGDDRDSGDGDDDRPHRHPSVTEAGVQSEFLNVDFRALSTRLVERRWFTGFFTMLTFYALYVPDIDALAGDKDSRKPMLILTTIVCVLFLFEIALHCVGKAHYACRPYFWLDVVSFISLLPDTYLMEVVTSNNAFVAGRSSRLTRVLFLTKSTRAARLNRLSRIVRVAALMPRLQRVFSRGVKDNDTERLLDKKLQRIFHFLDEDMDGYVSREAAERCLMKIRSLTGSNRQQSWASRIASRLPSSGSFVKPDTLRSAANAATISGSTSPPTSPTAVSECSSRVGVQRPAPLDSPVRALRRDSSAGNAPCIPDSDQVSLDEFRLLVLEDPVVSSGLRRACQAQIKSGNNMVNVTARNSEYIGVKIALWVLIMLFILSLIAEANSDESGEFGLVSIDRLARQSLPQQAVGSPVPMVLQDQVLQMNRGGTDWRSEARVVIYLELNKRVYCNDFVTDFPRCALYNSSLLVWSQRTSLEGIDQDLRASPFRVGDMVLLRNPDLSDEDISAEELERRTTGIAVFDGRSRVQHGARDSILTTSLVILIILTGIALVTKDLTFLSRNLLKPLVELADEMESASRLQLAGFARAEEVPLDEGISEIRLIRRTFENMKKAIKSWGKYVPWQVVQVLFRKDMEVEIEVKECEVSVFFSDIASFTTIVESLPPERSLLLLSRYFHDMSKIIDEYGGIVLEFIGDAILGIYGAPVVNEEHPTAAVKSAVRMIEQLRAVNKWLAERSLPPVQIRAGVHTGRALVGNMGFQSRMKYGIVGEESEIPARLEEMNKNYSTKLLISQSTFSRLVPGVFLLRPIDYVYLEADDHVSQLVYEVMGRNRSDRHTESHCATCRMHAEAMESYRDQNFEQAAKKFEVVNTMMKELRGVEDQPSAMLLRRCRHYLECPPPPAWDGVWDRGPELQ